MATEPTNYKPELSKQSDGDLWPVVGGVIAAAVIVRAIQTRNNGSTAAQVITTAPSYTRRNIDDFVRNNIQFAEGDTAIIQHQERIKRLFSDYIEKLPAWQQVMLMENPKPIILGKDALTVKYNVGGLFTPNDKAIRARHFGIEEGEPTSRDRAYYDQQFQNIIAHEEGHRIDNHAGKSPLRPFSFWSDNNPRWVEAAQKELELRESRKDKTLIASEAPAQRGLGAHLNHPAYKPSQYPHEALAELTNIFNTVYANRNGDFAATNKYMQKEYPYLWPIYRDEFIPKLKEIAHKLNPHIAIEGIAPVIEKNNQRQQSRQNGLDDSPKVYVDKEGYGWEPYKSSSDKIGQSFRYSKPHTSSEDAHRLSQALAEGGIKTTVAQSGDGKWYLYVPENDARSTAALKRSLPAHTIASPHAPSGGGGLWTRLLTAIGLGAAAGSAAAMQAPEGEKISTGINVAARTTAESASPFLNVGLAPNADEAQIRTSNEVVGVAAFGVGTVFGTPVIGGLASVGFYTANDEVQRLWARHALGKTATVAPSSGEQLYSAAVSLTGRLIESIVPLPVIDLSAPEAAKTKAPNQTPARPNATADRSVTPDDL